MNVYVDGYIEINAAEQYVRHLSQSRQLNCIISRI